MSLQSLHDAARDGDIDAVTDLLKAGADPNALDEPNDCSPLCFAMMNDHVEVMQVLLENGADPNVLVHGCSVLTYVSGVIGELGWAKDVSKVVELLLKHKADPNLPDDDGTTPLHEAARLGDIETAIRLLEFNAKIDAQDKNGRTPLHKAAISGHGDTVDFLLDAGADPTVQDKDGRTARDVADANVCIP
jgi:ankyrin repeat protein